MYIFVSANNHPLKLNPAKHFTHIYDASIYQIKKRKCGKKYRIPFKITHICFMKALAQITALVKKDLLLELRQKHTFYGIILYVASTVFVLYLTLQDTAAHVWNSLFWVIQLFVCVNAVAKSFLSEGRGRLLYFYTLVSPVRFIAGKLIYNVILMMFMTGISLLLFTLFLSNPLQNTVLFAGVAALGGFSLSMIFTLMSAIAAKAQHNATLMAILGFPLVITLLLLLLKLSKTAFGEVFREGAVAQLCFQIVGLDALIIVLAMVLFPYLWKE